MSFILSSISTTLGTQLKHVVHSFYGVAMFNVNNASFVKCVTSEVSYYVEWNLDYPFDCEWATFDAEVTGNVTARLIAFNESSNMIGLSQVGCQQNANWVIGHNAKDGSLIVADDFIRLDNDEWKQEMFVSNCKSTVYIDSALFLPSSPIPQSPEDSCGFIHKAVSPSNDQDLRFVMVSDDPISVYSPSSDSYQYPWSLSHWLSFCGLKPTTVHTWQLLPDDDDVICNVKYITNLVSLAGLSSLSCLSDVMDPEYRLNYGSEGLHSVFVSSLGIQYLSNSLHGSNNQLVGVMQRLGVLYFSELVRVLRAHSELQTRGDLRVMSIVGRNSEEGAVSTDRGECFIGTIHSAVSNALMVDAAETSAAVLWRHYLDQIKCIRKKHKGKSEAEVLPALHNIFTDKQSGAVVNLCTSSSTASGSYFCSVAGAVEDLRDSLKVNEPMTKYVTEIFRRQGTAEGDSVSHSSAVVEDRLSEVQRPSIQKFLDGECYVLVYLLPDQMEAANQLVNQYQADGDEKRLGFEAGIVRYLLFPISISSMECSASQCSSVRGRPSLRAALNHAAQFISDVITVQDVVFILNGLEALLSFHQPLSHTGSLFNQLQDLPLNYPGVIPRCSIGLGGVPDYCSYSLTAPVMISCKDSGPANQFTLLDLDFNALVGVGRSVRSMLLVVQEHPLYSFSGDAAIEALLREYAWSHPMQVVLDRHHNAFDISLVAQRRSHLSREISQDIPGLLSQISFFSGFFQSFSVSHSNLLLAMDCNATVSAIAALFNEEVIVPCSFRHTTDNEWQMDTILMKTNYSDTFKAGFIQYIAVIELAKHCSNYLEFSADLFNGIYSIVRFIRHRKEFVSQEDLLFSAALLEFYLNNHLKQRIDYCSSSSIEDRDGVCTDIFGMEYACSCSTGYLHSLTQLRQQLTITAAAIYQRAGWYDSMRKAYQTSLKGQQYREVRLRRREWREQRQGMRLAKTHFVTFASKPSERLEDLLMSANISLIDLQVVGMGTEYRECGDKVRGYHEYLHSPHIAEGDIVVMVDAYDVLLLPRARHIGAVLAQAETPIVFSSEAGVYQDFGVTAFYPRGAIPSNRSKLQDWNHMTHKYLNSGTLAGRAAQLRTMFTWLLSLSDAIKDDQRLSIAYHLMNPHLASLDSENKMFLTLFKMPKALTGFDITEDFTAYYGRETEDGQTLEVLSSVGIIHCNFAHGNRYLERHTERLRHLVRMYYSGEDGPLLIRAVNAIHDKQWDKAEEYLRQPEVVRNRTSLGGSNDIGDALVDLIHRVRT